MNVYARRPKDPIILDLFCGAGGTSQAIRQATGRSPTFAVNHWPGAIADHARAHPDTRHITASVFDVDYERLLKACPRLVTLSPSCTHHSNAAGGAVLDDGLRSHPHIAVDLARSRVAPDVFIMENVREILTWGPLLENGRPDPARRGESWRDFVGALRLAGYEVAWRVLNAADFGAPTSRKRLFMVARRDRQPIAWPTPTHGPGRAQPWVPAASVIDWSLPCPSIFDRKRPLAEATMRRIAEGVRRFVLNGKPFIVCLSHGGRVEDAGEPLRTTTTAARGERALVTAAVHLDRAFTGSAGVSVEAPLSTVCASYEHHSLISSTLVPVDVAEETRGVLLPMPVVDDTSCHAALHIERLNRTSNGEPISGPLSCVQAQGGHHALISSFLVPVGVGERAGQPPRCISVEAPLLTVTAKGRPQELTAVTLSRRPRPRPAGPPSSRPSSASTTATAAGRAAAWPIRCRRRQAMTRWR